MDDEANSIREELEKEGYSKEEEYFNRINRQLIERKRKELDEKRTEKKESSVTTIHWMKCPKCGDQLKQINLSGIYGEQCIACRGIYFDSDEFETLLEAKMPKGFLKTLLKKFRSKIREFDTTWRP